MENEKPDLREIPGPEGKELADLGGVRSDLLHIRGMLDRLEQTNDHVIRFACFTASMITYRRCFNQGKRGRLDASDVASIGSGADDLHDFFLAQANKLVAHSINPFEGMKAGIHLEDGRVVGVGTDGFRLSHYGPEDTSQWKRLMDGLIHLVDQRMRECVKKVAEKARNMAPEQLAGLPKLDLKFPAPGDADKTRRN